MVRGVGQAHSKEVAKYQRKQRDLKKQVEAHAKAAELQTEDCRVRPAGPSSTWGLAAAAWVLRVKGSAAPGVSPVAAEVLLSGGGAFANT